ncbi:MAG: cbb3-type cytochrome oxidase assembly protein CcoS [Bacteroidales bacterium]|nr:cbb3-type cytochrome oxidase assembly protein CcoS [Bacteroidales bacterium]
MSVVFILIIIGVVVAGGFLVAFIWAVKSGQYEDSYSPSVRVLFDDYVNNEKTTNNNSNNNKDDKKESDKSNKSDQS